MKYIFIISLQIEIAATFFIIKIEFFFERAVKEIILMHSFGYFIQGDVSSISFILGTNFEMK